MFGRTARLGVVGAVHSPAAVFATVIACARANVTGARSFGSSPLCGLYRSISLTSGAHSGSPCWTGSGVVRVRQIEPFRYFLNHVVAQPPIPVGTVADDSERY